MEKSIFETDKFIKLMGNEEFVKELSEKQNRQEIQAAFDKQGVTMTADDIAEFATVLDEILISNVSGGKSVTDIAGEFISAHPWLSAFIAMGVVGNITTVAVTLVNAPSNIINACRKTL